MKRRLMHRRRGVILAELVFALAIFSIVIAITAQSLSQAPFKERSRDIAFMNRFKGAIVNQRVRSVREPGVGYSYIMPGDGQVFFKRNSSTYLVLNDPDYKVNITPGVWSQVITRSDFRSWTNQGTNGFTILIYKKDKLLGKLIFQVVTSSFREVFYDN